MAKYRAIQWATGAMGKSCLRALIDNPAVELAGLFVYGEKKAGLDAGSIARRDPTGILATRNADDILALDADVVVHCARLTGAYGSQDEEIIRLLESGKNVISINGYTHPRYWGGERFAALQTACLKGNSTLLNAGLNPGFAGEQLAVLATGLCSHLDHIEVIESASGETIKSPDYAFTVLGFGSDPARLDPNDDNWGPAAAFNGMYAETISVMAERLGLVLDRIERDHRVLPASKDLEVAAGLVPQGTVSHVHFCWHGIVEGRRKLTMSIHWYMEAAHLDNPEPPLWQIKVEGQPGIHISVEMSKRPGDLSLSLPEQIAVAGSVINAIPLVCEAGPGVLMRPVATPHQDAMSARLESV